MVHNLLQAVPLSASEEVLPFSDRLSQAGIVTLQGMLTIFLVLAILWVAIEIMHRVVHGKEEKPQRQPKEPKAPKKSEAQKPVPNAEDAAIAAAIAAAMAASEDEGALIAAITAAVSAALAEDGYTGGFRVVSFKRATTRRNRF